MRHENTVFHQLTNHFPWDVFDASVARHGGDKRVRRCRMKDQCLALLYGQFSGVGSLRAMVEGLSSQSSRLYHSGGRTLARSTLSDANRRRPSVVYEDVFTHMTHQACRRQRRSLGPALRLIDATKVKVSGTGTEWARFTQTHKAVKLHVVFDPVLDAPVRAETTTDRVNDITPAKAFPIDSGATYVFDLAYYSYDWWAKLHKANCRFVTRFKSNTRLCETRSHTQTNTGEAILSDTIGYLPQRMARSRKNPFSWPMREVVIKREDGRSIRLATNDLDSPAEEIAHLYKQRWQIELLFRWIKQNLGITKLIGRNANAVRTQMFVALIAYLILRTAYRAQSAVKRPVAFARLIRQMLFMRRPILDFTRPPEKPNCDINADQFSLI